MRFSSSSKSFDATLIAAHAIAPELIPLMN